LVARTQRHSDIEELAASSDFPVINGLSDVEHPCQAISDFLTILEKRGKIKGLKLAFVGDANNVANSLMLASCMLGADFSIATPGGYEPKAQVLRSATDLCRHSGSELVITNDPAKATRDADVVYTDVWVSMGEEKEINKRRKAFGPFQVNSAIMSEAKPNSIFMHCLPAHRGEEVSSEVIDGPQSVVYDQAENRLHAQKAILVSIIH